MNGQPSAILGFVEPKTNYFPLPNEWFTLTSQAELTPNAHLVLLYLAKHTWGTRSKKEVLFISIREISEGRRHRGRRIDNGTGLSLNTIRSALRQLVEKGFVEVMPPRKPGGSKGYRIRIREEDDEVNPPPLPQTGEDFFPGFTFPKENYFKVPNEIFDIARAYRLSALQIRILLYCFRHGWGYQNTNGVWLTAQEIAFGRVNKKHQERYDEGIGNDLSGIYRALASLTRLGFLVSRVVFDENHASPVRQYNLHFKDAPTMTSSDPDKGVEGLNEPLNGQIEPPIGQIEPPNGQVEPLVGQIEPPIGQVEPLGGQIESPIGQIEPLKARQHTFKDTPLDTSVKTPGQTPAQTHPRVTGAEPLPHHQSLAVNLEGQSGIGTGSVSPVSDIVHAEMSDKDKPEGDEYPPFEHYQDQLRALGWQGNTQVAQRLYQIRPGLLDMLFNIVHQRKGDLHNPAGWLNANIRKALKDPLGFKHQLFKTYPDLVMAHPEGRKTYREGPFSEFFE